jgi:hypothetical protein
MATAIRSMRRWPEAWDSSRRAARRWDAAITRTKGMGGQGVLPIPVVYNGWVQNLPASWKSLLTPAQRNPFP